MYRACHMKHVINSLSLSLIPLPFQMSRSNIFEGLRESRTNLTHNTLHKSSHVMSVARRRQKKIKTREVPKTKRHYKRKNKENFQNRESYKSTCHQCKLVRIFFHLILFICIYIYIQKTYRVKMRCSICRPISSITNGVYCTNCVKNRYKGEFNEYFKLTPESTLHSHVQKDKNWKCFTCRGICNCRSCKKKRKKRYRTNENLLNLPPRKRLKIKL